MNCEKNAVVCEGYPEKQIWKSGRDRLAEGMCIIGDAILKMGLPYADAVVKDIPTTPTPYPSSPCNLSSMVSKTQKT